MKNENIVAKIKRAFSLAAPDIKDSVISRATNDTGKAIIMTNEKMKKNRPTWQRLSAYAAAAAVFVFAILGGVYYSANFSVSSTISLDVNPSVEITVSKNESVIDVTARNADGKTIIGDMDLKGANVEVAVNALIGSMLKNGYINELANSILISVENKNDADAAALREKLTAQVDTLLTEKSFSGAILTQTVTNDKTLRELAEKYGITVGKAQLIDSIVKNSTAYTFESLVSLSINELNLIAAKNADALSGVDTKGEASDKAFVGTGKAFNAVFDKLGIGLGDVTGLHVDLDYDNGFMVYEVDFIYEGKEYECEVNAATGEVIKIEIDDVENYRSETLPNEGTNNNSTVITKDKALEIALLHAGLKKEDIKAVEIELDNDDGAKVYEIEFHYNESGFDYEFDYEVSAVTGTILKSESVYFSDYDGDGFVDYAPVENGGNGNGNGSTGTDKAPADGIISEENAIKAAAAYIKAEDTEYGWSPVELDYDDGRPVYEFELYALGYEHEFEVCAYTGKILDYELGDYAGFSDYNGDGIVEGKEDVKTPENYINEATALKTATDHAGIDPSSIGATTNILEYDDGRAYYDIHICDGKYEYEYEIDAVSGKVIEFDKEICNSKKHGHGNGGSVGNEGDAGNTGNTGNTGNAGASDSMIGEAKAKEAALSHAGVKAADAKFDRVELDRDDGRVSYEIEFCDGTYEYEYDIDAYTGEIIKSEKDICDDGAKHGHGKNNGGNNGGGNNGGGNNGGNGNDSYITEAEAEKIALDHAGVKAADARFERTEMDRENGKVVYEIEFKAGGYEYSYEIDAVTGKILDSEKERDD